MVKTAIAGEDANWGRVVMAIGKTKEKIRQEKTKIKFGNNILAINGQRNRNINISKVDKYMKNNVIEIEVSLGLGKASSIVFGNEEIKIQESTIKGKVLGEPIYPIQIKINLDD